MMRGHATAFFRERRRFNLERAPYDPRRRRSNQSSSRHGPEPARIASRYSHSCALVGNACRRVCALLAAVYSLIAPRKWRATQTLIVRPEAASVSDEGTGKFADLSEMKTLQETILELAKSQSVVQATLREVGPPSRYRRPEQWPTPLDVGRVSRMHRHAAARRRRVRQDRSVLFIDS